jgi:hypothetical protein
MARVWSSCRQMLYFERRVIEIMERKKDDAEFSMRN